MSHSTSAHVLLRDMQIIQHLVVYRHQKWTFSSLLHQRDNNCVEKSKFTFTACCIFLRFDWAVHLGQHVLTTNVTDFNIG